MITILYIEGLDCEDEAKLIRSKMEGLKGIASFEINIMARTLKAVYDENLLTEQDIVKAVAKTGMNARRKEEEAKKVSAWWKEPRILTLSACGLIIFIAFITEYVFNISHRSASFLTAWLLL